MLTRHSNPIALCQVLVYWYFIGPEEALIAAVAWLAINSIRGVVWGFAR